MYDPARLHVSRLGNPKAPPHSESDEPGRAQLTPSYEAQGQFRSKTSTSAPSPVMLSAPGALVDTASPASSKTPST